jgi:streptogramin lyase
VFSPDGEYLEQWTDVVRPCAITVGQDGLVYVAELWRPVQAGQLSFVNGMPKEDLPGRVSVFDPSGSLVTRWGADSNNRCAPGNFIAPHGVCVDAEGSVYVAEVTGTYGVRAGRVGAECAGHQIQKFVRV